MSGIAYAVIVMVCFGVGSAFWKIPARAVGPIRAVYFRQLYVVTILGAVLFFVPQPPPFGLSDLGVAILIALFGYLPLYFFLRAVSSGVVGVVSGIANAKVLVTIVLGQLFLGDTLTGRQWALTLILVVALVGLAWQPLSPTSKRLVDGAGDALIACLLWGIVYFVVAFPVSKLGPFYFAFILELGVLCAAIVHLKSSATPPLPLPHSAWPALALCVITAVIGTVSYNIAISRAPISIVAAISFSSPVVATLIARVAFGERLRPLQLVAMATIVLALSAHALGL